MTWMVGRQASLAFILAACFSSTGLAYEFENGVPLTLGFQLGETRLQDVRIRLNGHEVELAISLHNPSDQPQYAGFYAATPLFGYLGEGEEYADKSFRELKAFQDGQPLPLRSAQRAYFLGQDITPILRKAGIGPLYSNEIHWKRLEKLPLLHNRRIDNWQSQATFGWSARLAPKSTAIETIRYSALPKFALEMIDSDSLTRLVQQHCGSPEKLREALHRAAPQETQVFSEVFEFPLPSLALQDTRVTIEKPTGKVPGGRAFAALACGFDGAMAVPSDGTIRSATYAISVLVVSLLYGAQEEADARRD